MFMSMRCGFSGGMGLAVHVGVNMADRAMLMVVHVEVACSPAAQQPQCQRHDDDSDDHLGSPLDHIGQRAAEEQDRQAEDCERCSMPQAPGQPQQRRSTCPALISAQQQAGHRREVIGIEGVPQAEDQRDDQWETHRNIIPWPRSEITDIAARRRIDSRP